MISLRKVLSTACWMVFLLLPASANGYFNGGNRLGDLADRYNLRAKTIAKLDAEKRLNRREKREVALAELDAYKKFRREGFDEVSNTEESIMLRNYRLRNKKKLGLLRRKKASLSQILFPGVSPEEYKRNEPIWIYADPVSSKKTHVPYDFYDVSGIPYVPDSGARRRRPNLGARLQGRDMKPAPFKLYTLQNSPCEAICSYRLRGKELRWMKRLIERQYRFQLKLDQLPVLMRSSELNYAVRGYPVGFKIPKRNSGDMEFFLYNHLKFAVTYHRDPEAFDGIRIVGFDVHPVSIAHHIPGGMGSSSTCRGMDVENDSSRYLSLSTDDVNGVDVLYSYDVTWVETNNVEWANRWDVYVVHAVDVDMYYYSVISSLVTLLIGTAVSVAWIARALRKDLASGYTKAPNGYTKMLNKDEQDDDEEKQEEEEERGWKALHGHVFCPPQCSMLLSVLVGTGAQIGLSFSLALFFTVCNITNIMNSGEFLTSVLVLYPLCGAMGGYWSAKVYKLCGGEDWKRNVLLTAAGLPSVFITLFIGLNVCLSFVGAATAVNVWTISVLVLLWLAISAPLVVLGASFVRLPSRKVQLPPNAQAQKSIPPKAVPKHPWYLRVGLMLQGAVLFYSLSVDLAFFMYALWLNGIFYDTGFSLISLLLMGARCALTSIVLCFLQLRAEDHRWWWKSFVYSGVVGLYVFLYSIWYLNRNLDLHGSLAFIIYVTYMGMISICVGLCCGSVGFLSSLWFTQTIYGPVPLDVSNYQLEKYNWPDSKQFLLERFEHWKNSERFEHWKKEFLFVFFLDDLQGSDQNNEEKIAIAKDPDRNDGEKVVNYNWRDSKQFLLERFEHWKNWSFKEFLFEVFLDDVEGSDQNNEEKIAIAKDPDRNDGEKIVIIPL